ncbi:MAG TPA: SusC/RagA family TonB-linked outer membrane protein [Gemmatimonadales bacterium]|nr:SusC/RagA family TonB-linked outer membrane protein [Gemmatimonadales bacterium]
MATGLALAVAASASAQEPATITGTVKSDAGQPLGQVEVAMPSMALAALTKDDGRYTIVVPGVRATGQAVALVARRLGYKAQTVQITLGPGAQTHDFTLVANPLQLGEVVVTGAGTATQAEKLGNVRNQVDSSLIQRSDEVNFVEALAGKAPNVEVVSAAGDPGASSFIRIRGANTINGSGQPLIVVDGTPIDNSTIITGGLINNNGSNTASGGAIAPNRGIDLNPNDIANVEILKGASAAAIYGARAGQGVVLITTKSGQAGPTRTTFRSEMLVNNATQGPALQTIYGQGTLGAAPSGTTGEPPVCLVRGCRLTSGSWGPLLPAGTPVYDHFNELFTTGFVSDNNLTVSGGDERTLFYISGEYLYDRGDMHGPNNHFQRSTVRMKASQKLLSNLTLSGNFSYADTRGAYIERGSNTSGLLLGALRTPPEFNNWNYSDPATGLQRSYRYPFPDFGSATVSRGYDNPIFVLNGDDATGRVGRVYGNVDVSYLAISWLRLEEVLGVDYSNDERLEGLAQSSSTAPLGVVTEGDYKHLQIDHNLTATASYTVSPTFAGTVTLGQGLNSRTHRQVEVTGNNLIAPNPFNLANTVFQNPPNDSSSFIHTESFFGQATADLYNQLYLTAAVRNDGSSTFGASTRRHWFPKASAAWEFTKAVNGGEGLGVLNYGKARVAYGQTGTEPGVYQTINAFSTAAIPDAGWGSAITPTQSGRGGIVSGFTKGQASLGPERTKEVEGGVDLAFVKGERVDAHYTYYHETSSDVIFQVPLAPSAGFGQQAQNAATIRNVGHEVSVNLRPVQTPEMNWSVGLQWAKNTNTVTNLVGVTFVPLPFSGFTDPQGEAQVGYPLGELRGTDFERCGRGIIDPTYGNIDALCGSAPKGAVFLGSNGYPLLDANFEPIADPTPKWTGSVQSSLQYHKWTVSGLLDVKYGGQMWNGTKGALTFFGTHASTLVRDVTRTFGKDYYTQFTFAGPGVGVPVLIDQANWYQGGLGSGFTGPSSQFVEDAGYVKLREIAVAYTFDQPWVHTTFGFDAIDVRVSGRNLKTWTNYTGIDPETNLFGADVAQQGFDYFGTPQTRSFTFSITLHH